MPSEEGRQFIIYKLFRYIQVFQARKLSPGDVIGSIYLHALGVTQVMLNAANDLEVRNYSM